MKTTVCAGQPSWQFASNRVDACVTRLGSHLAPVRFHLPHAVIEPYAVAPWAQEPATPGLLPLLRSLRGDFFCAPFGGNETPYRGERHPPHGETANALWKFESLQNRENETTLHLSLAPEVRPGRVDEFIRLRENETAIYCRHVISGMSGRLPLGHHALLKLPPEAESGNLSTSKIRFAQVLPTAFENPEQGGYSRLKPGAVFTRLDRVATLAGERADLSRYPTGRGFDDLVLLVHDAGPDFAWSAMTYPKLRYVWFALKDPRILRSTLLWMSNGGRYYSPWNGRHSNVLGIEDVTSFFHYGVAESARPNTINQRGFATSIALRRNRPFTVNYIMAVAEIPSGFNRIKAIVPGENHVTLVSTDNHRVTVPLDVSFLGGTAPG